MIIIKSKPIYLIWVCVVVVIICLVLLYFMLQNQEPFNPTENPTDIKEVSLDEFNKIFDSSMVELPGNIKAIGYNGNDIYIYKDISYEDTRIMPTINYFNQEILPHLHKTKFYFLIVFWDGFLERNQVSNQKLTPYYPQKNEYIDMAEIKLKDYNTYPILHSKKTIFAYSKHVNDNTTVCIPDFHYTGSNGYKDTFKEIDDNYVDYNKKQNICVWRGNIINGSKYNFFEPDNKNEMNQRTYFANLYNKNAFRNIDYSKESLSIPEQLQYKYILDIDGYTSAWDATAWKLYSGSVMLKVKGVWEQWFYSEFKEWVHYVPVENDFSDLNEKIKWCINNNEKCKEIAKNARQFAIKTYNWDNAKKHTIDKFNKYL